MVKTHGGRQQFYPIPPKTVVPNLQSRAPDMSLSDNTANSLRNVERDQWQTTYDLQHTGIGPSNPMSLENLNNKMNVYYTYGVDDDNLVSKINSVSVLYIVIRYQPFNVLFSYMICMVLEHM